MEILFKEYKSLGEKIIDELDNEDFENLEILLDKRETVLKKITDNNNSIDEMKALINKYEILKIEEALIEKLRSRRDKVKENIVNLRKMKNINNRYRNGSGKVSFLNKEI